LNIFDDSTLSWDAVADEWVAHADTNDYHNDFLMPVTLQLLGDVSGKRILDLGCGEGSYARAIAQLGASVVGVDSSERLIEIARQRTAACNLNLEFVCTSAGHLTMFPDADFDVVLASMSLMSVADYPAAIHEIWRVLRRTRSFWMSILHPCFSARGSEWCRSSDGKPLHFAVDRYFDRGSWGEKIALSFSRPVVRYHRPLEDYMAAPLRCGLALRAFHEPCASDAHLGRSARFWTLRRIPYFLFMHWQKL
jgi:SAM-dependent methyltransferase